VDRILAPQPLEVGPDGIGLKSLTLAGLMSASGIARASAVSGLGSIFTAMFMGSLECVCLTGRRR